MAGENKLSDKALKGYLGKLISAFMTTAAANFATLTEREIAEAEEVTTINIKSGEQAA